MKPKYFGTDGIRGTYGNGNVTEAFSEKLAQALIGFQKHRGVASPSIVVGRDPRISGQNLAQVFIESWTNQGGAVFEIGIVPTPVVAYAVKKLKATMGLAITASHNPASDNGFKLFNGSGTKFTVSEELEIESFIGVEQSDSSDKKGSSEDKNREIIEHYINDIEGSFKHLDLTGMRIAVDCANGATLVTTPLLLKRMGAELFEIGTSSDGSQINNGVGSECLESVAKVVKDNHCSIGLSHDGDGDRLMVVDATGAPIAGEQYMAILSSYHPGLCQKNDALVTTIQSNLALDHSVKRAGKQVIRTQVGDRNVVYAMLENGSSFGGENSGHYVFSDVQPTGDGLVAALKLLETLSSTGKPLEILSSEFSLFPSKLKNLKVREKIPLQDLPKFSAKINEVQATLGDEGRVLVRYSGTEPKIRVLVECPTEAAIDQWMGELIETAASELDIFE